MRAMTKLHFSVVPENTPSPPSSLPSRKERDIMARAKYERLWRLAPYLENPGAEELIRQERCLMLGQTWGLHRCQNLADLGCGDGRISLLFASSTTQITGLDIAQNALSRFSSPDVHRLLGSMPDTTLPDQAFEGVLCTDLLTELDPRDYRLAISEMARILVPQGLLLFSCPIDCLTDQPLPLLRQLLATEFALLEERASHHRLAQSLTNFITKLPSWFPGKKNLLSQLTHDPSWLFRCERLSRLFWGEQGVTHLILCCRKKTLPFL